MAVNFLDAQWRKLAMANYAIDPLLLTKHLPYKTELDFREGLCYVSLVGFMFQDTAMLGMKIPFHINFEEVNLRFYVKYDDAGTWKRGVVFISEIVPKFALSFVANSVYGEHYRTMRMSHEWKNNGQLQEVEYKWKSRQWNSFSVTTDPTAIPIDEGSEPQFITEHYWGYTRLSETKTSEYEVGHPKWDVYPMRSYEIDVDFGGLYGSDFEFLKNEIPTSVFLAEGSEIFVKGRKIIR